MPAAEIKDYYDDCRICCNPIHLRLHIDELRRAVELYIDSDDSKSIKRDCTKGCDVTKLTGLFVKTSVQHALDCVDDNAFGCRSQY